MVTLMVIILEIIMVLKTGTIEEISMAISTALTRENSTLIKTV